MTSGTPPRLLGLVLSGGRSQRMQRDKAALEYRPGQSQLDAAMKLLEGRVAQAYVSLRADQRNDDARSGYRHIIDRGGVEGPIAGISAALAEHPDAAWLVLACDLPFLDAGTLDTLIAARDRDGDATAFKSAHAALERGGVERVRAEAERIHPPATGGMKTTASPALSDCDQSPNSALIATRNRSAGSVKG